MKAARRYPRAEGLAAVQVAGDTSDTRIRELLEGGAARGPELWLVFHALAASGDERALDLALRLASGPWPDLRRETFMYLAGLRSERAHEFFIDFLVLDEGQHPWLTEIANEYLAGEPDGD